MPTGDGINPDSGTVGTMTFLHRLAQRIARLRIPVAAFALGIAACSQGERADFLSPVPNKPGTNPSTNTIQSVRIEPRSAAVQAGSEFRFTATALSTNNTTVPTAFDWIAESGTISSDGRYVGLVPGPFRVIVRAHDQPEKSDTAVIAVWRNETDPTGITIQPASITIEEGDTLTFSALLNLANGVVAGGATVAWSTTGGAISSSGFFVASTAGEYLVSAQTTSGYSGSAFVRVLRRAALAAQVVLDPKTVRLAPGQGVQFNATTVYTDGKAAAGTYTWLATGGGTLSQNGAFTAGALEGTFKVVASAVGLGLADTATVTIAASAPTLTSLSVAPKPATVQAGGSVQFVAQGTWSNGSISQPLVTWTATGGSISTSGLYTAGSVGGTYRVIATHQGGTLADTASVTVQPPTVVALGINPRNASVQTGGTQQFTASAAWSNGSTALPALTWSATGGTISSGGLYTAGGTAGTFRVIVTGGGKADTASVSVGAPTVLVSLTVSPKPAQLVAGGTLQFSASALWSNGTTTLPTLSWSATGGTITSTGLYSAGANPGSYRVIASGGGRADTSIVTVTAVPAAPTLLGLTVSPNPASVNTGGTRQFNVTASWSDGGTTLPAIGWSATGGTINASGLYTAGSTAGTYRVIASGGGKADTAAVTLGVPPAPPSPPGTPQFATSGTMTTVSWTPGSGATSYRYTAGANAGGWAGLQGTSNTTSASLGVIPAGLSIWACITSVNSAGDSPDYSCNSYTIPAASGPSTTLQSLKVNPNQITLSAGASQQFSVSATWSDGSGTLPPISWAATGGTISAAGLYTAGTTAGIFRVIASGGGKADTASVTIGAATVTAFSISPRAASLATGGTQQFGTSATWSDGGSRSVPVTYTANGGTISSSGLFTAGSAVGTFAVIASCGCGRADTAAIQVTSASVTLTSLMIAPRTVSLVAGGTQLFVASALWSNGTTTLPALSWNASGGAVTAGSYTAGTTPGTYRVVVSGGGRADTATVMVTSLPPQGSVIPDREFDPDRYTNPVTFLQDSRAPWGSTSSQRPFIEVEDRIGAGGSVTLESPAAGGFGGRTRVMRYNFPQVYGAPDGSVNIDYTLARGFALGYNIGRNNQIWWEAWIRFAPNWYSSHSFDGAQPNAWYKFLLVGPSNEGGRFDSELNYLCNLLSVGTPNNDPATGGLDRLVSVSSSGCTDGNWHRFRGTMRVATGGGVYKLWIDDSVILDWTGNSQGTRSLESWYSLGPANANRGWKYATWMDLGLIRFFTQNPGW
jgi:hypothetical protein